MFRSVATVPVLYPTVPTVAFPTFPTAPYLPIALDSPGMSPILDGATARITVPVADADRVSFDAVTAELTVNTDGDVPLLCVTGVHDIASGDLSLPGIIMGDRQ